MSLESMYFKADYYYKAKLVNKWIAIIRYSPNEKRVKAYKNLVFKMMEVISWANENGQRWAFTGSNAGSHYFNDFCNLADIDRLNWAAIHTNSWSDCREAKQAEFLVEKSLPWHLVEEIGVYSIEYYQKVCNALEPVTHKPLIKIKSDWYY